MIITGFVSFGYELVLQSEAVIILGSSNITMGIIISMFIFGYLSSFWFGRFIDRSDSERRLVSLFLVLEVLIALVLVIIVPVTRLTPDIADALSGFVLFYYLDYYTVLLITISLLALIIPLIMGGEIPIAMKLVAAGSPDTYRELGEMSGLIYAMDSLGAGFGGLMTALYILPTLGKIRTPPVLASLTLIGGALLFFAYIFRERFADVELPNVDLGGTRAWWRVHRRSLLAIFVGALAISTFVLNAPRLQYSSVQLQYNSPVIYEKNTRYQQIVVTDHPDLGYTLYLNGQLQTSEEDEYQYHEPLVHVPMVTHPDPRTVLIIGGGDGGALEEVLKHDTVEHVDLVELDPAVIETAKRYLPSICKDAFDDERLSIHYIDGWRFLREYSGDGYDVAILDLPDPETETVALLYTREFYSSVREVLREDGICVTQSTSSYEYPEVTMSIYKSMEAGGLPAYAYETFVWSFGPWSFVLGSKYYDPLNLSMSTIDERIANRTLDALEMYSSSIHFGYFHMIDTPLVSKAMGTARVSTVDHPVVQPRSA